MKLCQTPIELARAVFPVSVIEAFFYSSRPKNALQFGLSCRRKMFGKLPIKIEVNFLDPCVHLCMKSANDIHHRIHRGADYTQIPSVIRLDHGQRYIETATDSLKLAPL